MLPVRVQQTQGSELSACTSFASSFAVSLDLKDFSDVNVRQMMQDWLLMMIEITY